MLFELASSASVPTVVVAVCFTTASIMYVVVSSLYGRKSIIAKQKQIEDSYNSFWPFGDEYYNNNNNNVDPEKKRTGAATATTTTDSIGFMEWQCRRIVVFWIAARVFIGIKWTQARVKRLKKSLGVFDKEDPALGDDHPAVVRAWEELHERNATMLTQKLKQLEGFWVKCGQYFASRSDIMPKQYTAHLSTLQDSMPPRSLQDTWLTIVEEFSSLNNNSNTGVAAVDNTNKSNDNDNSINNNSNSKIQDIFEYIDPKPLSTASIAQVHRAVLKTKKTNNKSKRNIGKEVVIKVQHRGASRRLLQDMDSLKIILDIVAYLEPDFDFVTIMKEYNTETRKELDFRLEAASMDEIRAWLEKEKIKAIIPRVVPALVTERVLVMEYCPGFSVKNTPLLDKHNVDRELLLKRVCSAWAVQIHVAGVFNADPHAGNILVSTANNDNDEDPSIPVLLDFGLTKRFTPKMKLAFARLMHGVHETDVDGLLRSFEEMNFKLNRYDPFEDMANAQKIFGTTWTQSETKERREADIQHFKAKMSALKEDGGIPQNQKLRSPIDAYPSEFILFGRVTMMLRGLCTRLNVRYSLLQILSSAAGQTLRESIPIEERSVGLFYQPSCPTTTAMDIANDATANTATTITNHETTSAMTTTATTMKRTTIAAVDTPLQHRLMDVITELHESRDIVGVQVCVIQHHTQIANIAAGTLGTANSRPVKPSTLFNIFSVTKSFLSVGLMKLYQDGHIASLDDPVSKYWPGFSSDADCRSKVTVRHVLTHQAGLANNAMPDHSTIDTLLDWEHMKRFISCTSPSGGGAKCEVEPGTKMQYHAITYAWLAGGLIEEIVGKPYDEYLEEVLQIKKCGLDLWLGGLPVVDDETKKNETDEGNSRNNPIIDYDKDLAIVSFVGMEELMGKLAQATEGLLDDDDEDDNDIKNNNNDEGETKEKTASVGGGIKQRKQQPPQQEKDKNTNTNKTLLPKYRGKEHLLNPSVFNMKRMRQAKIPSANGHASAAALATAFDHIFVDRDEGEDVGDNDDGVTRGNENNAVTNVLKGKSVLNRSTIELMRQSSMTVPATATTKTATATGNAEQQQQQQHPFLEDPRASFGLGVQIHEFEQRRTKKKLVSIGHGGIGGSFLLAVPEARLCVALTVNKLLPVSPARKSILGTIFDELDLVPPSSLATVPPSVIDQ